MKAKLHFSIAFFFILISPFTAQNLLNNGDFESGGNGVGFNVNSAFYSQLTPPYSGTTNPGSYAVASNPQAVNTGFIFGGDHTSGTGNMLLVDGTTTGGGQRFWRAGNNGEGICGLTIGATYTFSYWIKSVSNSANRAFIDYQFNNASTITLVSGTTQAPLASSGWQQVVYTFRPTNNCVNFEIWNTTTTSQGNDFAVDDFRVIAPPQPLTLTYSAVNPSCPGGNDGYIVGYGSGANPPYVYSLTGSTTATNGTGVFSGLSAGTYSLKIEEGADGQIAINNIILTNPQDLIVNNPITICNGEQTALSVSGSNSLYTWTSSPNDLTLTTPNSTNPNVSPSQTTTYTVTSSSSSGSNLVFNGNFSQGNLGFITDYIYYNPTNPTNVQRSYGIVTNSFPWEIGFSNCTDHTGGGKMMVVDGSIINGGNDKVWCQTTAVVPNQNYTFSYWIQTVATPNPANIDVVINGASIGINLAPTNTCNWIQRSYTWNSGTNTTAQICMFDRVTLLAGNDFALDDISFVGPTVTCNLSKSVTVTVNQLTVPNFQTTLSLCTGAIAPTLTTTSPNGISGTWIPNTISNTTSGSHIFQPDANQCATSASLKVIVNTAFTPAFNITNPICAETTLSPLPEISANNITGTWTPVFDNITSATYFFTPAPDQCASGTSFELVVTPKETPTFSPVGPFCTGVVINNPLPTISSNGIFGSWTPVFNNTATTTYTFTPDISQCATITILEVIIVPSNLTPTFDFGTDITSCYQLIGEVPELALPSTSTNNIFGIWTPATINYAILGSSTYTFTPIVNTCASNFTLTITIIAGPELTLNSGCDGDDFVLRVNQNEVSNSTYIWYNTNNEIISNAASVIITQKGDYKVKVTNTNGCSKEQMVNIPSVYCKIPKGISPNADDLNDSFDLSNLNVQNLKIYNRYGTEVYSKSNYKKEWEGKTNSGHELPDGTYYYVVDFETGKSKTGWVYINK